MAIKILAVSGSMRVGSHGTKALGIILEHTKAWGAETRMLDLREIDLPMYRPDISISVESVLKAMEAAAWADVFILGSPDYHGSMSGAIKNYLDYHWEEFAGKLFGYVCTSHERGLTVMDQMRTAVRQCYGWSLPYNISFNGGETFDKSGNIIDTKIEQRFKMMARDLMVYGELIRNQFQKDLSSEDKNTFVARYRA